MKWLAALAKKVHDTLAPLFGMGLHPSHAMSGALSVVDAAGQNVLFETTANFNPERGHVERQLLAAMFIWTKDVLHAPFTLPPGCSVNLYVYNSPCQDCAAALALTIRLAAGWGRHANRTVTWNLAFTNYYTSGAKSYNSGAAADIHYGETLTPAGWRITRVVPVAAAAAPAAAAAGGPGPAVPAAAAKS